MPEHVRMLAGVVVLLIAGGCSDAEDGESGPAAAEPRECAPVGTELEEGADETIEVALDDDAFSPDLLEVEAVVVTFRAENVGEEEHELAFLPGGGEVPMDEQRLPDEDALAEAGAFELEAFGPGQTCDATNELEAGDDTVFCIVRAEDGSTHLAKGMRGELTVR